MTKLQYLQRCLNQYQSIYDNFAVGHVFRFCLGINSIGIKVRFEFVLMGEMTDMKT